MAGVVRGEVILCNLSPTVGTEQSGTRPVLVLQTDKLNPRSPHTIVAPFTSKIRKALLPSHVLVAAGTGGLTQDSVLLCEQIRVVDEKRIVRTMGKLDDNIMTEVAAAVRITLDV